MLFPSQELKSDKFSFILILIVMLVIRLGLLRCMRQEVYTKRVRGRDIG